MVESGRQAEVMGRKVSFADLPTIPTTLPEILRVASDPRGSASELEIVVSKDQSLVARVLKIANSPLYGFSRRIETVHDALVLLGTKRVRSIASAMGLAPAFGVGKKLVDGARLWSHALACAMWTQEIATAAKVDHAQELFVAGLMHDFGIVIMDHLVPGHYEKAMELAREEKLYHPEAEQRLLKTDHARVGAAIAAAWLLPLGLTQLIEHHHYRAVPAHPSAQILALADHLAARSGVAEFAWETPPSPAEGLGASLGLTLEGVDDLAEHRSPEINDQVSIIMGHSRE